MMMQAQMQGQKLVAQAEEVFTDKDTLCGRTSYGW